MRVGCRWAAHTSTVGPLYEQQTGVQTGIQDKYNYKGQIEASGGGTAIDEAGGKVIFKDRIRVRTQGAGTGKK